MAFQLANIAGRAVLVADGAYHDLSRLSGGAFSGDMTEAIERHGELHALNENLDAALADGLLEGADLGPPSPAPSKAFGIGLNYRAHAEESNMEIPEYPPTFAKFPSCISGPNDDIVLRGTAVDYEVEVVVIIGTAGRDISQADSWSHVAGVTGGQDVSDRRVQFHATPPQFALGKSFDTYGPIGPLLVSVDSFENPDDIGLSCGVSGDPRQSSRTSDLIFDVPTIIEYLSGICTLNVGDVIFTGTPAGVGAPKRQFLGEGDVVVSTFEGIGTMTNHCVAP